MVQFGIVGYGVVQCGIACYGVVWHSMVWCGVVSRSVAWHSLMWCSVAYYSMVWRDIWLFTSESASLRLLRFSKINSLSEGTGTDIFDGSLMHSCHTKE